MFESLGLENWTPLSASLVVGGALGLVFGILAQISRFCLRRGLVGTAAERSPALGLWLTALVTAILGTQALSFAGIVDFSEHRFFSSSIPAPAIILGGLMFGIGMVLARGCASRLTVLSGTGNLRALTTILVFAVVAHATLKGALAPARVWLSGLSVDLGAAVNLTALPGDALVWTALAVAGLAAIILRQSLTAKDIVFGVMIGALIPAGWFATGALLLDEFDPIALESLAFTSASSEALFWTVAGTAIVPGFGVGLFAGVLVGSLLSSLSRREFAWTGFSEDLPTHRYLIGGSLMGVGGVLAGGCTVGAGLSGVSMLSVSAILALVSIVTGALLANGFAGQRSSALASVPAE